jgi:PAS domain S-box-containing protein
MPPAETRKAQMTAPVDYKLLFERSTGSYLILDPGFVILAATDAYCHVARVSREAIIGRDVFEVFGDLPDLKDSLARVLRARRPDAMAIRRRDVEGAEKHWSPMNVPVLDDAGAVTYIIHRVRDVTESVLNPDTEKAQRRLADEQAAIIRRLRAANEELAQLDTLREGLLNMSKLNTIALMASALAHDVSQPLTAAKNYLSVFRRSFDPSGDAPAKEMMGRVMAQIDRASEIVKNLRRFIAAGNTVHRPEDVAGVVADAVRLAESVLKAGGAALSVEVAPNLPPVTMDRVQIQQVLFNLLTNAAGAVAGRARRTIAVTATPSGRGVRIAVADSGAGLAPDVAQRLFEPLTTTKVMGLGLGLPICSQIVKQHGGDLAATPNSPEGTVFVFTLPAGQAAASRR